MFPFSISSTYFRKSRSRWKPYGVSTEYGGFPFTPLSFVFRGKVLPGDQKSRNQCSFKGNILRNFVLYLLAPPSYPCLRLYKQTLLFNVWEQKQIISEASIKHQNGRRDDLILFLNFRGKRASCLRFHSGISHERLSINIRAFGSPWTKSHNTT